LFFLEPILASLIIRLLKKALSSGYYQMPPAECFIILLIVVIYEAAAVDSGERENEFEGQVVRRIEQLNMKNYY